MGYLPHDNNNNNNNKEDNLLVGINRCMVNIKPSRLGVVVKIANEVSKKYICVWYCVVHAQIVLDC